MLRSPRTTGPRLRLQTNGQAVLSRRSGRRLRFEPLEELALLAVFWDGGGTDNNWNTPANWSGDQVPDAADDVIIDLPLASVTLDAPAGASIKSLVFSGTKLRVSSSLTAAAGIDINGNMEVVGSTITSPALTLSQTTYVQEATLDAHVVNQGLLQIRGDGNTINGGLSNMQGGTVDMEAARYSLTRLAELTVTGNVNNAGTIQMTSKNSGTLSNPTVNLTVDSGSLFNESGGVIDVLEGGFGGSRNLTAELINDGVLNLDWTVTLDKAGADHVNTGTINSIQKIATFRDYHNFANSGIVEVSALATLRFLQGGDYTQTSGSTNIAGGHLEVSEYPAELLPIIDLQGGTLSGIGRVSGHLVNSADVAVGNPIGELEIHGNYTQTAAGVLTLEIGGPEAELDHDLLYIWGGGADFDGSLAVDIVNGYAPPLGQTFEVITYDSEVGQFAVVGGASAGCGGFTPTYNAGNLTLEVASLANHITELNLSADPVLEGSSVTLSGAFTSPDASAPTQVEISWGDGSADTVLDLSAGELTFGALHVYEDGPNTYLIDVSVTGHPCGTQTDATSITVNNVAPTATLSNDGPVDEGGAAAVGFADQADPSSADTAAGFTYNYDFGADGTFEIVESSSPTADLPANLLLDGPGSVAVRAQIVDKDDGVTELTTTITVNNVPPNVDPIDGPNVGVRGQELTFVGSFTDPGVLDAPTAEWQIAAGDASVVATGSGTELSFTPTVADTYTVSFTVTDKDGDSNAAILVVNVGAVQVIDGVLFVGGEVGGGKIDLKKGSQADTVVVLIDGTDLGEFGGIERIVVFGQDGNDDIKVQQSLGPIPAELFGGPGDDKLRGGQGDDVLVGGPGEDLLHGQDGRDLLIGGNGRDKVIGHDHDDILIGGTYVEQPNRVALLAVMAEWTREDLGYNDRVAHLIAGTGLAEGFALNDSTVFDDDLRDILKGNEGRDWFLADDDDDDKTDLELGEILTEIELQFIITL